jgi:hypothetical protein
MKRFSLALCAAAIVASYAIVWMPPPEAAVLLREDGPIEQATMAFFLLASVTLLLGWKLRGADLAPRDPREGRRVALLILALLMFVCAGEEISWGQRIFGWDTPEKWSAMNAQVETNLHNLVIIEGGVRHAETQTFFHLLTNANRLFALFWLTFFVVVPVLGRCSGRMRVLFRIVGVPIAPLWIGGFFLLNQAAFIVAVRYLNAIGPFTNEAFPLDELKEHNAALTYSVAGIAAWLRERAHALATELLHHGA